MTTNNQLRLQRRIASEYQLEAAKYHADFRTLRDDGGFALDTLAYYLSQAEAHYWVARVMMGTQFDQTNLNRAGARHGGGARHPTKGKVQ